MSGSRSHGAWWLAAALAWCPVGARAQVGAPAESPAEAPIGVQLYVGSCAAAIDRELLALIRDELETSGFEVDAATAELHVSVAPACRGRDGRVTVSDAEGRLLASREIAVGGLVMPSRVIALTTAETLRQVVRGEPSSSEHEGASHEAGELAEARAALERERTALDVLRSAQESERSRAAALARENERLAALAAERERLAAAPPARSRARARLGVTVYDGVPAGGGELGGELAVAHEWTVGAWIGARGARSSTDLGEVSQLSLDVGVETLFWLGAPREVAFFVGPSVAGGASLAWGQAGRADVESAAGSAFHFAVAAAIGLLRELDRWTVSVAVRGGYVLGGLEPTVDARAAGGLRGLFLSVGLELGWMLDAD